MFLRQMSHGAGTDVTWSYRTASNTMLGNRMTVNDIVGQISREKPSVRTGSVDKWQTEMRP